MYNLEHEFDDEPSYITKSDDEDFEIKISAGNYEIAKKIVAMLNNMD